MTQDLTDLAQRIASQAPEELNLTNGQHLDLATQAADAILDAVASHEELAVFQDRPSGEHDARTGVGHNRLEAG